jgi:hypothetical protein
MGIIEFIKGKNKTNLNNIQLFSISQYRRMTKKTDKIVGAGRLNYKFMTDMTIE